MSRWALLGVLLLGLPKGAIAGIYQGAISFTRSASTSTQVIAPSLGQSFQFLVSIPSLEEDLLVHLEGSTQKFPIRWQDSLSFRYTSLQLGADLRGGGIFGIVPFLGVLTGLGYAKTSAANAEGFAGPSAWTWNFALQPGLDIPVYKQLGVLVEFPVKWISLQQRLTLWGMQGGTAMALLKIAKSAFLLGVLMSLSVGCGSENSSEDPLGVLGDPDQTPEVSMPLDSASYAAIHWFTPSNGAFDFSTGGNAGLVSLAVMAPASGWVIEANAGVDASSAYLVLMHHPRFLTRISRLGKVSVAAGQYVTQGQVVGSTPASAQSGYVARMGVWIDGRAVCPYSYFSQATKDLIHTKFASTPGATYYCNP